MNEWMGDYLSTRLMRLAVDRSTWTRGEESRDVNPNGLNVNGDDVERQSEVNSKAAASHSFSERVGEK
jgi:hypothetical protein